MNTFHGCRETAILPELAVVAITVVVEFLSINSAPLFGGGMIFRQSKWTALTKI